MKTFHYKAADSTGKVISGDMAANDRGSLFDKLQQSGLTLIEARDSANQSNRLIDVLTRPRGEKYSRRELAHFFRSLSAFLNSGVTIDKALKLFGRLRADTQIGALADRASEALRAGRSLSAVLAEDNRRLPPFIVPMIETGEISARIAEMTEEVADLLERQQELEDEIITALTYPAILLATALIAVIVITTIVLPQFEPLFERSGAAMPWISAAFLGFAAFLREYGLVVLIGVLALLVGLIYGLRRPGFRATLDRFILSMPWVGDVAAKIELSRFFRGFGLLLTAGVALPRALSIAAKGARSPFFADLFASAEEQVRQGTPLSEAFTGQDFVPNLVPEFLVIGEESGQIGPIAANLAALFSDDVARATQRFLRVLSPAITIGLGLFVAGLVASILLALLSLNDLAL